MTHFLAPGSYCTPALGPATPAPLGFSSSHHSQSRPPCPPCSWITPFLKAAVFPDPCASQSSLERQSWWKTCLYIKEVCFKESPACVLWGWQFEMGRAGLQPGNRQELGLQSQGRTPSQGNLRFCSQGSRLVRWFIQMFFFT